MKRFFIVSSLLLVSCTTAVPPDYTSCENNKNIAFRVDPSGEAHGSYSFTGTLNTAPTGDEGGSNATGLFFQVQADDSPAYDYFSNMVHDGNTVNGTKNENLNFKLGVLDGETIKSEATISADTATTLVAALKSGESLTLDLVTPIESGKGASAEFSFACSIAFPDGAR